MCVMIMWTVVYCEHIFVIASLRLLPLCPSLCRTWSDTSQGGFRAVITSHRCTEKKVDVIRWYWSGCQAKVAACFTFLSQCHHTSNECASWLQGAVLLPHKVSRLQPLKGPKSEPLLHKGHYVQVAGCSHHNSSCSSSLQMHALLWLFMKGRQPKVRTILYTVWATESHAAAKRKGETGQR